MPLFKVVVSWELGAELLIEANSLEEAIRIAEEEEIPDDGKYIDGSWVIWDEMSEEIDDDIEKFRL